MYAAYIMTARLDKTQKAWIKLKLAAQLKAVKENDEFIKQLRRMPENVQRNHTFKQMFSLKSPAILNILL